MSEVNHGIRRISENVYDIYIREGKRRGYRLSNTHVAPGVFGLPSQRWWKNGVQPKRDSQREKCYAAERTLRPGLAQRKYDTVREAATFFRNIMESDWFQRRFPHFFYLRIAHEPGTRAAHACPTEHIRNREFVTRGWIGFSKWAMGHWGKADANGTEQTGGELIMLHELAHAIIPGGHEHDRRWARTFIELVRHYMGRELGDALKASMRKHKVKFAPIRVVSPERRRSMGLLLAAARSMVKPTAGLQVAATLE